MGKLQKLIDNKAQSAKFMCDEIAHICNDMPKRDPGSEGEKMACEYMADYLKNDCGCERSDVETFTEHPNAFFGWIYFTITLVLAGMVLFFFLPILGAILTAIGFVILFVQFGLYKKLVDKCFPQKTGHSVTAIKKCTGEVKGRVFFNGHPDAVWNWPVNNKFGGTAHVAHLVTSVVSGLVVLGLNIAAAVATKCQPVVDYTVAGYVALYGPILFWMGIAILVMVPCLVGMYFMWDENTITDGANDNLTGCYMGIAILKAMKDQGIELEHTEVGVIISGSEEAGLRGSIAFTREHKGEPILENTWNINIDSVADKDFFEVVIKDDWQFCRFDTDLEKMFKDTFNELGIVSKTNGCIHNPVGGCDSTPMTKAGMKSVTFAAQDPTLTYYYHTWHDVPERFELETVGDGFDVILGVIDKIDKFQQANGFNGPQK